ncbi:MAG: type II toxin-antitoxin system HicB family antitoxin [Chloroflexota bacterium]|nr:type II toxin-antitoxin system HicB family antitoxin [Chloroflexota bacterium]
MIEHMMYTVILTPEVEDGGYSVAVPALKGCHTQGETVDEALANAREAIAAYVESLKEDGLPVPVEEAHPMSFLMDVVAA